MTEKIETKLKPAAVCVSFKAVGDKATQGAMG